MCIFHQLLPPATAHRRIKNEPDRMMNFFFISQPPSPKTIRWATLRRCQERPYSKPCSHSRHRIRDKPNPMEFLFKPIFFYARSTGGNSNHHNYLETKKASIILQPLEAPDNGHCLFRDIFLLFGAYQLILQFLEQKL